ncbi:MAG TPA: hypothetical protein VF398_01640 [bacterium]
MLQIFLNLLARKKARYCVVGGLAVNAYAEPIVSLDLDLAVVSDKIEEILAALPKLWKIRRFPHSINISSSASELRIQLQLNCRYQDFIKGARRRTILGYRMPVAAIENVLQGKIWAYRDKTRRASKRQKDLADIFRLVEAKSELISLLPKEIKSLLAS